MKSQENTSPNVSLVVSTSKFLISFIEPTCSVFLKFFKFLYFLSEKAVFE